MRDKNYLIQQYLDISNKLDALSSLETEKECWQERELMRQAIGLLRLMLRDMVDTFNKEMFYDNETELIFSQYTDFLNNRKF